MSTLGTLVVSLAANTAEFSRDLGKAAHEADKRLKDIGDAAEKAGKLMGVAFAASVASVAYFTRQAISSADSMYKLGQATGVTTEAFSEFNYVASLSGVNTEALGTSLGRLNRNISDTAAGTGEARMAFEALGLNVKDASGNLKNADEVLLEVADRFKVMADGSGKSAIALQLFGRSGQQMIPMLNQGSAGIKELREEAQKLGATITSETGQAAERFNDNLQRLDQVKKGLANTIMRELLPSLNAFTETLVEGAKQGDKFREAGEGIANTLRFITKTGLGSAAVIEMLHQLMAGWLAMLTKLGTLDLAGALFIKDDVKFQLDAIAQRYASLIKAVEQGNSSLSAAADNWDLLGKAPAPLITAIKETDLVSRQWVEAMAEEVRIMAEAAAATDLYASRIRALGEAKMEQFETDEERLAQGVFVSEEEKKQYEGRMKAWFDFIDRENEAYEEGLRFRHELDLRYMSEGEKFERMHWDKKAATIFGEMENITRGVAQHNRALFNINKVAGIANAIINAYEGISKTMATYPYPYNLAMAALHGVAAFAQVNAIRSASFEGGGGGFAPSIAGSAPAPPVTPVEASGGRSGGQTTIIQVHGEVFSRATLRSLIEQIDEEARDGSRIVLA